MLIQRNLTQTNATIFVQSGMSHLSLLIIGTFTCSRLYDQRPRREVSHSMRTKILGMLFGLARLLENEPVC